MSRIVQLKLKLKNLNTQEIEEKRVWSDEISKFLSDLTEEYEIMIDEDKSSDLKINFISGSKSKPPSEFNDLLKDIKKQHNFGRNSIETF
jgi:hypothetical protein